MLRVARSMYKAYSSSLVYHLCIRDIDIICSFFLPLFPGHLIKCYLLINTLKSHMMHVPLKESSKNLAQLKSKTTCRACLDGRLCVMLLVNLWVLLSLSRCNVIFVISIYVSSIVYFAWGIGSHYRITFDGPLLL